MNPTAAAAAARIDEIRAMAASLSAPARAQATAATSGSATGASADFSQALEATASPFSPATASPAAVNPAFAAPSGPADTARLVREGAAAAGVDPTQVSAALREQPGALKMLSWAASQVGTLEGPSNKQGFAPMVGHANNQPWCATFTVAASGMGAASLPREANNAYTVTQYNAFRANGSWVAADRANPTAAARPGDLVFFRWPGDGDPTSHVGLVVGRLGDGRLLTIEGNTGGQGGEGVHYKVRGPGDSIVGYGRPRFDGTPPGWNVPQLRR